MPLSDDQFKNLILLELGKRDDATAQELVDLLWARYDDQTALDPRLRPLLVKRDLLLAFLGLNAETGLRWEEAGVVEDDSKLIANYTALLEMIQAQLAQYQGAIGAAVGQLSTVTPITDLQPFPNPSERAYRGDPVRRFWPGSR